MRSPSRFNKRDNSTFFHGNSAPKDTAVICRSKPLEEVTPARFMGAGRQWRELRTQRGLTLQDAAACIGGVYLMSRLADIEAGRVQATAREAGLLLTLYARKEA
jgi:hypothetical protein